MYEKQMSLINLDSGMFMEGIAGREFGTRFQRIFLSLLSVRDIFQQAMALEDFTSICNMTSPCFLKAIVGPCETCETSLE